MSSSEPYASSATWIRAAELHEQEGDLQRALYEYRIAGTLSHGDSDTTREINRLQNSITEKTEKLIIKANKARRQKKHSQAKRIYIETLSLDPKHQQALKGLRELDEISSKKKMRKKVAHSKQYQKRRSDVKENQAYQDEGYAYSRQAILEAETHATDVARHIEELEKHIIKYSKDVEFRNKLLNVRIVQARAAFKTEQYMESLNHLQQVEKVFTGDKKALSKIAELRKEFGQVLYLKGVRNARSAPGDAVELWKKALKFDPEDKRSQLRIQNIETI